MGWPDDGLAAFFLVCFFVGLLFTVVSFFLGIGHSLDGAHAGAGEEAALGHAGIETGAKSFPLGHDHGGTDAGAASKVHVHSGGDKALLSGPSPVNLSTLMAFLTWFGGAGYILRTYYAAWSLWALLVGALAGLAGATLVFVFLSRVLYASQHILDPSDFHLPGTIARVTSTIYPGGTGEIVYSKGTTRHVAGARGIGGEAIAKGTEVVILRYEKGLAHVQPWDQLVDDV